MIKSTIYIFILSAVLVNASHSYEIICTTKDGSRNWINEFKINTETMHVEMNRRKDNSKINSDLVEIFKNYSNTKYRFNFVVPRSDDELIHMYVIYKGHKNDFFANSTIKRKDGVISLNTGGKREEINCNKPLTEEVSLKPDENIKYIPTKSIVKKIIEIPKDKSSWSVVLENKKRFIFSDEEPDYAWNYAGKINNYPKITSKWNDKGYYLILNKDSVVVPYEQNRDDSIRGVLSLADLVKNEYAIKYCIDSWHSSGQSFIALGHGEWAELEKEYGAKALNYRFVTVSGTFEEFASRAFTKEHARNYSK